MTVNAQFQNRCFSLHVRFNDIENDKGIRSYFKITAIFLRLFCVKVFDVKTTQGVLHLDRKSFEKWKAQWQIVESDHALFINKACAAALDQRSKVFQLRGDFANAVRFRCMAAVRLVQVELANTLSSLLEWIKENQLVNDDVNKPEKLNAQIEQALGNFLEKDPQAFSERMRTIYKDVAAQKLSDASQQWLASRGLIWPITNEKMSKILNALAEHPEACQLATKTFDFFINKIVQILILDEIETRAALQAVPALLKNIEKLIEELQFEEALKKLAQLKQTKRLDAEQLKVISDKENAVGILVNFARQYPCAKKQKEHLRDDLNSEMEKAEKTITPSNYSKFADVLFAINAVNQELSLSKVRDVFGKYVNTAESNISKILELEGSDQPEKGIARDFLDKFFYNHFINLIQGFMKP